MGPGHHKPQQAPKELPSPPQASLMPPGGQVTSPCPPAVPGQRETLAHSPSTGGWVTRSEKPAAPSWCVPMGGEQPLFTHRHITAHSSRGERRWARELGVQRQGWGVSRAMALYRGCTRIPGH